MKKKLTLFFVCDKIERETDSPFSHRHDCVHKCPDTKYKPKHQKIHLNLRCGRRLGDPASLVPEVFRPPRVAEGHRSTQVREARKLFARGV